MVHYLLEFFYKDLVPRRSGLSKTSPPYRGILLIWTMRHYQQFCDNVKICVFFPGSPAANMARNTRSQQANSQQPNKHANMKSNAPHKHICMQSQEEDKRATTNVQNRFVQFFYYLFFSFVLIELKPFVLKGKVPGGKFWKCVKKCEKVRKMMKRFCPLVVAL